MQSVEHPSDILSYPMYSTRSQVGDMRNLALCEPLDVKHHRVGALRLLEISPVKRDRQQLR